MSFRPTVSYFVVFGILTALGLAPIVFGILTALGLAWILRYEVWENKTDSFAATTIAVLQHMEWVVVVGGAATYFGVEAFEMLAERFKNRPSGVEMLAERFKKQQRMKGRQEGKQEGEQELAKRLLNMSDDERESEIKRIANGDE